MKTLANYIDFMVVILITALSGCSDEFMPSESHRESVTINFSIDMPEEKLVFTRSGDVEVVPSKIDDLTLILFDENGFYKDCVQAKMNDGEYKAQLTVCDQPCFLHFVANYGIDKIRNHIGNGNDIEDNIMSELVTDSEVYWQRMYLDGGLIKEKSLGNISLVSNKSELSLTLADNNFTLQSYWLYNIPSKGTVAPYNSGCSYHDNNKNKNRFANYSKTENDYEEIANSGFRGHEAECELIKLMPEETNTNLKPISFFERGYHPENPTFVIMKGIYNEEEYFYKLDIVVKQDFKSRYIDLFRGFKYILNVKVKGKGYSDMDSAVKNIAGNNLESSTEIEDVNNFMTDNKSIHVEYVNKVIQTYYSSEDNKKYAIPVDMKYKYIPDVKKSPMTTANNDMKIIAGEGRLFDAECVKKMNEQIASISTDEEGYSLLHIIPVKEPGENNLSQNLYLVSNDNRIYRRIKFLYNGSGEYLYDYDAIYVNDLPYLWDLGTQAKPYYVYCAYAVDDKDFYIDFQLPDGLQKSMFPLQFRMEAESKNLNSLDDSMPLEFWTSLFLDGENEGTPSFGFIKNVTWDSYCNDNGMVSCHFKFNTPENMSNIQRIMLCNEYFGDREIAYYMFPLEEITQNKVTCRENGTGKGRTKRVYVKVSPLLLPSFFRGNAKVMDYENYNDTVTVSINLYYGDNTKVYLASNSYMRRKEQDEGKKYVEYELKFEDLTSYLEYAAKYFWDTDLDTDADEIIIEYTDDKKVNPCEMLEIKCDYLHDYTYFDGMTKQWCYRQLADEQKEIENHILTPRDAEPYIATIRTDEKDEDGRFIYKEELLTDYYEYLQQMYSSIKYAYTYESFRENEYGEGCVKGMKIGGNAIYGFEYSPNDGVKFYGADDFQHQRPLKGVLEIDDVDGNIMIGNAKWHSWAEFGGVKVESDWIYESKEMSVSEFINGKYIYWRPVQVSVCSDKENKFSVNYKDHDQWMPFRDKFRTPEEIRQIYEEQKKDQDKEQNKKDQL